MWELDCEESWAPKNWCFWTVVLEKTLESPLGCKEIQPVHPEGDQSWVFIGRTDAEAETPIIWPPHAKSWLTGKYPDDGRDWGLGAGREGDDRGWDGWMASLTQWTWVWVNSRSWWWTGKPGMLWFMGLAELDTTEWLNSTGLTTWQFFSYACDLYSWSSSSPLFFSLGLMFSTILSGPFYVLIYRQVSVPDTSSSVHLIFDPFKTSYV